MNYKISIAELEFAISSGETHKGLQVETYTALIAIAERLEEIANQLERLNVRRIPSR